MDLLNQRQKSSTGRRYSLFDHILAVGREVDTALNSFSTLPSPINDSLKTHTLDVQKTLLQHISSSSGNEADMRLSAYLNEIGETVNLGEQLGKALEVAGSFREEQREVMVQSLIAAGEKELRKMVKGRAVDMTSSTFEGREANTAGNSEVVKSEPVPKDPRLSPSRFALQTNVGTPTPSSTGMLQPNVRVSASPMPGEKRASLQSTVEALKTRKRVTTRIGTLRPSSGGS